MRNYREVLEKEQVKELLTKIKGDEKKQKKTILWVILAAVAVSAIVAFLVVRYFTEHDCCECDCDDEYDDMYEITCPACNNSITVDFDVIQEGSLPCPNCGENLEFDLSCLEDDECDCGCND